MLQNKDILSATRTMNCYNLAIYDSGITSSFDIDNDVFHIVLVSIFLVIETSTVQNVQAINNQKDAKITFIFLCIAHATSFYS